MIKRRAHSSSASPGTRRRGRVPAGRHPALPVAPLPPAGSLRERLSQAPLWGRMLWALGFSLIGLLLFWVLRPVFAVLAASMGLAYILDPLVDAFERRGFSREAGIGIIFTAMLVSALLLFLIVVPSFLVQAQDFSQKIAPFFQDDLEVKIAPILAWIKDTTGQEIHLDLSDLKTAIPWLQEYATQIRDWLSSAAQGLLTRGLDILSTVVNLTLLPIFVFYLLRDWDRMVAAVGELIPMSWRPRVGRVMTEVDGRLAAFIRGQITVCLALAFLYSLGLVLIGLDLAVPVGVLSGLLFIVPYLGTAVGVVLAGLLSIMEHGFSLHFVWAMLVFVVVQIIEGYLLTPRIVGEQVGLHPLVVMIALIVGGSLLGIWGMLLAIPITAVLSVLGAEWLQEYYRSAVFRGAGEPPHDSDAG